MTAHKSTARPYRVNLTGQKFGQLTVVSVAERLANSGDRYWICQCDCGEKKEISGWRLRSGETKSCGKHRAFKRVDISGLRFGMLSAIEVSGKDRQGRMEWICICDCGTKKVIPSRHLLSGRIVSCGCYGNSISAENGRKGGIKNRGIKSHLYKPDLTDEERLRRRNMPELRDWRKSVFARDNYTCQLCGQIGKKLQAHHIYSWAEYRQLRFEIHNGITLCRADHKLFHDFMGGPRFPCTPDDFERFKARWHIDREIQRLERKEENRCPTK